MLFSAARSKTGDANRSTRCRMLRNYIFLRCIPWFNPHSHVCYLTEHKKMWCCIYRRGVFLPTCPDEASRLMVVRSIQPRLASSLWLTSRNWTMARLAASGETNMQTRKRTVNEMESDSSLWLADGLLEQWSVMQRINHLVVWDVGKCGDDASWFVLSTAHFCRTKNLSISGKLGQRRFARWHPVRKVHSLALYSKQWRRRKNNLLQTIWIYRTLD